MRSDRSDTARYRYVLERSTVIKTVTSNLREPLRELDLGQSCAVRENLFNRLNSGWDFDFTLGHLLRIVFTGLGESR